MHASDDDSTPGQKLTQATATSVLGEYDHEISFDEVADFAIIYGPNGVGKTKFLEMIDAVSNMDMEKLSELSFDCIQLRYADGSVLDVQRSKISPDDFDDGGKHKNKDSFIDELIEETSYRMARRRGASPAEIAEHAGLEILHFSLSAGGNNAESADFSYPALPPNKRSSGILEDLDRTYFFNDFESHIFGGKYGRLRRRVPKAIRDFVASLDVKLIDTQRLVIYGDESEKDKAATTRHKIIDHSTKVQEQLQSDLSDNSKLTQSLDSTFPRRMLLAGEEASTTEKEIRDKLADQNQRRSRIAQVMPLGLDQLSPIVPMGLDSELPVPEGELKSWQASMLELYLEDTEQKLDTFSSTIEKIDLLEDIVNARLLRKKLRVTLEGGLEVFKENGGDKIPLEALSSGEQHEIIMVFDLLFNMESQGLVLIDEPEISLHIAWQKKFIDDVVRISRLVGFQFVIATHSPQIIGMNWRNAQRLGPDPADDAASFE